MKRILLCFLLFLTVPVFAQNEWPEAFVMDNNANIYTHLPNRNWQYINTGEDSVAFNNVIKPEYSKRFKEQTNKISNIKEKAHIWVRFRIKNAAKEPLIFTISVYNEREDVYINRKNKWEHFVTGYMVPWSKRSGIKSIDDIKYTLAAGEEIKIYANLGDVTFINGVGPKIGNYLKVVDRYYLSAPNYAKDDVLSFGFFGFIIFALIFNLFFYYVNREKVYLVFAFLLFFSALLIAENVLSSLLFGEYRMGYSAFLAATIIFFIITFIHTLRYFFRIKIHFPGWDKFLIYFSVFVGVTGFAEFILFINNWPIPLIVIGIITALGFFVFFIAAIVMIISLLRKKDKEARLFVIAAMPFLLSPIIAAIIEWDWIFAACGMWTILVLSWGMFARFKSLQIENARAALEKEEERNRLIAQQNELLEQQVAERTAELQHSLENLKQTQAQLIQSEKMASLGELTAGIAHEIQNPLNFVNNFSDVSVELLQELKEEVDNGDLTEVNAIADDVIQNLEKIAHHGRRADNIVKGMLQHSRSSSGQKEPTDINILADEFLRLAYHGLRAKDKSFNAEMITNFSEGLPKVTIISQDVGRVLLNLFNNAFYATQEKSKQSQLSGNGYKPVITVTTLQKEDVIQIIIKDNGIGIPPEIKDKILQPFFTTKPTGEGTGLGLSLSYDIIVKAHGGTLDIESQPAEGAEFIITLPVS
ncbi:ATP-binding protein [Flavobacterium rivuli]|nr:ATP-binding protein [Flavobacterium rivuli]